MNHRLIALLVLATFAAFSHAQPSKQFLCANRQSPTEASARIDSLIAAMTPEERILQLGDRAPAIPRLHLPAYNWWNEGLHGIARNGYATVFPQAIGLAATWDPALLHEIGDTVSTEARARFNQHRTTDSPRYAGLTVWSPNINIFRDPRWGRGQETYGEDPFLTAALGRQFVRGLQGDDPFYAKTDATPKHFAAHSGPESGRDSFNAKLTPHDLADTYLPAFYALTADAGAHAVMCSYNAINGTPACANPFLLQQTLRTAWGFTGYVVSDCDAVGNLTSYQHFTPTPADGAAAALHAGVDLDCGNSYKALKGALARHLVTQAEIDKALHRLLAARLRLGLLDAPGCSPFDSISNTAIDTPASRALARRAAAESLVLLLNDGTLPLDPQRTRLAIVGPTADTLSVLEANYHGTAKAPVTPLHGLREEFHHVTYAQGSILAAGVAVAIPETAFRTGPSVSAPHGLQATYFNAASVSGKPAVQTIVPTVELDLDRTGPSPAITSPRYAARWSGYFTPPAPGDYTLAVQIERCWDCTTHDAFTLRLGGKTVLTNHGAKGEPTTYTLHAADTHPIRLTLELLHTGEDEGITLAWIPPASALLAEAVQATTQADAIVAFVGLSPTLEGEALQVQLEGFDGGDRTSLNLPALQQDLLRTLQQTGKPLIVVLTSGSAVALPPAGINALLAAWYPGEEGGAAIAQTLAGKLNPSGRLPVTFYRSVDDLPAFTDYSMAHRTYRYFDGPVLYPFGSGLSYSRFKYTGLKLSNTTLHAGDVLTATATLSNSSARDGDEVVQLYLLPPDNGLAPHKTLQGTQRIHLRAGQSSTVTFRLMPDQLTLVDAEGKRKPFPGSYGLFVGGGQPGTAAPGVSSTFNLR